MQLAVIRAATAIITDALGYFLSVGFKSRSVQIAFGALSFFVKTVNSLPEFVESLGRIFYVGT